MKNLYLHLKIKHKPPQCQHVKIAPLLSKSKARAWLNLLPNGSIKTWLECANAFIAKYYPPSKTTKLRNEIMDLAQMPRFTQRLSIDFYETSLL